MKIAVAKNGELVSEHFGHCDEFLICEIDGNTITNQYTISNPEHQPGFLPGFLASHGVELIIAGGMGSRAKDLFAEKGIQTISGVTGSIKQIIDNYLQGNLIGTDETCQGHQHSNSCGH